MALNKTDSGLVELKNHLMLEFLLMCDVPLPLGGENGGG